MKEIILCSACKGEGKITTYERCSSYDSKYVTTVCSKCLGSGRLIKETVVTFKPYIEMKGKI